MALPLSETQRIQVIQHPTLSSFNAEFGTGPDLSRYESIRSDQRATSSEVTYLNHLQMGAFIPSRTALLLKNNFHDAPFVTHTTRSILYDLRQSGKMGEVCFNFLHEKVNAQDFQTVFKYLYILMLYSTIASTHDAQNPDPAFRFESAPSYSTQLVRASNHVLIREEKALQDQSRKQFMTRYLTEVASRPDCPVDAQRQALATVATLGDAEQFRNAFLSLMDKLQNAPELEKICWKELQSSLTPFTGDSFYEQAYLRLKTENYYKSCLSRVSTLKQSLERTDGHDLLHLTEQCKKAYNGCIYLLGDSKNMARCSPMRYAALTGKMRTEWQSINNIFNRAQQQYAHRLCSCQVQTPPTQNELAEWPFNSHPLIPLQPAQPVTVQQIEQQGIAPAAYQENQKRTVAVLSCKWGGGHTEAARGISTRLSSVGYHPVTVDLPAALIAEDPIRNCFITRWLGKDWTMGTLCEGVAQQKAFPITNFLRWGNSKISSPFGYSENQLNTVLEQLLKINPDSVITTYSAHNEAIIEACKILGIPCIHVATDVDTSVETRAGPSDYRHFKMAVPLNHEELMTPILNKTTPEQRFISGPPLRHEFTVPHTEADIRRFKQIRGIDQNKKVVFVTSGKNGSFSPYPEILARKYANTRPEDIPIHLIVSCGNENVKFQNYLNQHVRPHTNLPMTVETYYNAEDMDQIISMASYGGAIIGKAGGGTVFESFARGTRLLIDDVRPRMFDQGFAHFVITSLCWFLKAFGFGWQLPWEKINAKFAVDQGIADRFRDEKDFLPKLEALLNNDNQPVRLNFEVKNAETEIPTVLRQMIVRAEVDLDTHRARQVVQNL